MCEILKTLRGNGKIMYMCRPDDYVFRTAHGTAFFPSNIRRDWKKILAVLLWNINALKHGGTAKQHSCLPKVYRCWKYVNASGTASRHIPLFCTATPSQILIKTLRLKLRKFTALQFNKIKLNWCKITSFFVVPTLSPVHADWLYPLKTQKTLYPHGYSV